MKKKGTILAGLLLATIVTGYSVAGTYARYTSSIDLTDEARVAKWELKAKKGGCTLVDGKYVCDPITDGQQIDLFANSYKNNGTTYVKAVNNDRVVAPGTTGTYGLRFAGTMEVAHDFDIDFNAEAGEEVAVWYNVLPSGKLDIKNTDTAGYKKYSPIKYTLRLWDMDQHPYENPLFLYEDKSLDDLQTSLTAWKSDAQNFFAPGRLDLALDITWEWDTQTGFAADATSGTNKEGLTVDQVNELDTWIGKEWSQSIHPNAAADKPENNFGTKSHYSIKVSATQIAEDYSENK